MVLAYLLGTFPTAILVSDRHGFDPTTEGSGNPGASNVYRSAGRRAGAIVLIGDLLKGAVAAAAGWLVGDHFLGVVGGAAAVAGHIFPVFRGFRGGKGVATAAGMVIVTFPLLSAPLGLLFAATAKLTRTASLASITTAVALPIGAAVMGAPAREVAVLAGVSALVVLRHQSNIRRILDGEESPLVPGQRKPPVT